MRTTHTEKKRHIMDLIDGFPCSIRIGDEWAWTGPRSSNTPNIIVLPAHRFYQDGHRIYETERRSTIQAPNGGFPRVYRSSKSLISIESRIIIFLIYLLDGWSKWSMEGNETISDRQVDSTSFSLHCRRSEQVFVRIKEKMCRLFWFFSDKYYYSRMINL